MNLPLLYLGALILGAVGGAASNAYQGHDLGHSIKGGIVEGLAIAITIHLCYIIFGVTLTS